jgi:hypothetical protein
LLKLLDQFRSLLIIVLIGAAIVAAAVCFDYATWRDDDFAAMDALTDSKRLAEPVRAQALKFRLPDGSFRIVKSVRIPARPYLRPAADAVYPKLAGNIRTAFKRMSGPSGAPQGGMSDA